MNIHDVTETHAPSPTPDEDILHESIEHDNDAIFAHITQRNTLPPGYLRLLLSNNDTQSTVTPPADNNTTYMVNNTSTKYIKLYGTKYRSIFNLNIAYCHSRALTTKILLLIVVTMVDCVVLISVLSKKLDGQLIFRV